MSETSRRAFMAVAGAGAAASAVAATAGPAGAETGRAGGLGGGGPVMVYIEDPAAGRLTVMSGDDEVDVVDAELVSRILRAAGVR